MKSLVVEDDFAARKLMQRWLSQVSDCDIAVNGIEAVAAFNEALTNSDPYDLICLDIMMPLMDGHQALEAIRQIESEQGIVGLDSVKVIMTTVLGDSKHVMGAFREGCEGYVVKPVEKQKLLAEMERLGLLAIKVS